MVEKSHCWHDFIRDRPTTSRAGGGERSSGGSGACVVSSTQGVKGSLVRRGRTGAGSSRKAGSRGIEGRHEIRALYVARPVKVDSTAKPIGSSKKRGSLSRDKILSRIWPGEDR